MAGLRKLTLKDNVLLHDGEKYKLVELVNVRYFETYGNYSKTYFDGGMFLINRTLNYLESSLPDEYFFRTNRQHIVNLSHIANIHPLKNSSFKIVMSCGKEIELSRRRSRFFRETLSL